MLYFINYFIHNIYLKMFDNQNSPEQDQSLISANQTTTWINLLPQLIQIFIIS